jgi:outer membrane receptor protein involved in Fe transport
LNVYNPATGVYLPGAVIKPYSIINAQYSWDRIAGQPLTLTLFVKNLFNEKYLPGGIDLTRTLGVSWRIMGPPRTAGARLRYTF